MFLSSSKHPLRSAVSNKISARVVNSQCAIYLIKGEVPPTRKSYDDEMDVDSDDERYLDYYCDEEDEESFFMSETKIVLVGEVNLESAFCPFLPPLYQHTNLIQYKPASKSQFLRIFSPYIYALSLAPIRVSSFLISFRPSLICLPTKFLIR
jgi:hypothetical protein